jgi:hypothetical protein
MDATPVQTDPVIRDVSLVFAFFLVFFTFLWNWEWRFYLLTYRVKNPTSRIAYALRVFAAVCFLAACGHLIMQLRQPYHAVEIVKALAVATVMSVVLFFIFKLQDAARLKAAAPNPRRPGEQSPPAEQQK